MIYTHTTLRAIVTPGGAVPADAEWWKTQAAPAAADMIDLQGELGSSTQAVLGIVWYGYLTGAGGAVNTAEGGTNLSLRPLEKAPISGVPAHTSAVSAGAVTLLPHGIEWQIAVGYKRLFSVHVAAAALHASTEYVRFLWRRIS